MSNNNLLSISPLDGRYSSQLDELRSCFSEYGYIVYRLKTEILWFEAISNIVEERLKNGKFNSINDFLSRVNPKDINKLQLEGLVKAGAFDSLNSNRQSLFVSIPSFISKNKYIHDNKKANHKKDALKPLILFPDLLVREAGT